MTADFVLTVLEKYGFPTLAVFLLGYAVWQWQKNQNARYDEMFQTLLLKASQRREDIHRNIGAEARRETPWRVRMAAAMETAKDTLEASRIELFELHNGGGPFNKLTVVMEVLAKSDIVSWSKKFSNIPMSLFPNLSEAVTSGEVFSRDDISETTYAERFLVTGDSTSMGLVIAPLTDADNQPFGFVLVGWEGAQRKKYIGREKVGMVKELAATIRGFYLAIGQPAKVTGQLDPSIPDMYERNRDGN